MSIIPFPQGRRLLPGFTAPAAPPSASSAIAGMLARLRPAESVKPLDDPPAVAVDLPPAEIRRRGKAALKRLEGFIGGSQLASLPGFLRGEEGQWYMEKLEELAARVESMPFTYQTDGQGDDAICYLHYFHGGYDGYLIEKDMEEAEHPDEAQWQAFGFVHWAHMPGDETKGYICLPEIFKSHAELDFHFKPRSLREIKRKLGIEVEEPATGSAEFIPPESSASPSGDDIAATLAALQQQYLEAEDGWKPGAILVETWGYEQTNKDFYQITARKGEWLTLVPLTASKTRHKDPGGTDAMRGTSLPGRSAPEAKPFRRKLDLAGPEGPIAKGHHSYLRLWQGKPESWTDYA